MENFALGIREVFSIAGFSWLFLGSCAGIIFGAIPGINPSTGIALVLPVTFLISSNAALALCPADLLFLSMNLSYSAAKMATFSFNLVTLSLILLIAQVVRRF